MSIIDSISPDYMGQDLISLQLNTETLEPRALSSVIVDVDYSSTEPEGVVLPLELTIRSPTPKNIVRRIFRTLRPSTIAFTPQEGGPHLVLLRETAHNRYVGILTIEVTGDRLTELNI